MLKSTNGIAWGLISAALLGMILLQCSPEKPKRPTPIAAPNPPNLDKPAPQRNPQSENLETNPNPNPNPETSEVPPAGNNAGTITTVPAGALGLIAKEATILVGLEGGMKCEFAKNTKLILTHRPVTLPNEELVRISFEKIPGCDQTQGLIFKEQFSKI